ncbi:MAG TPA: MFS transporter, partial [Chthonomonadales bacterium]|nr:MFS transporter [Chthonomonadales bacterium]
MNAKRSSGDDNGQPLGQADAGARTHVLRHPVNVDRLMRAIVVVAGFAELAYIIVNVSGMPVYIKVSARLDERWIGAMAATFLIVEGVLKSPCGLLGDHVGRKAMIMIGPLLSTFTAALTPLTHNPYLLLILRTVDGIGAAALWPAAFSLIGDHVPEERRSRAMGTFNIAYLLGVAVGPAIGGFANQFAHHQLHLTLARSKDASFYVASGLFGATA